MAPAIPGTYPVRIALAVILSVSVPSRESRMKSLLFCALLLAAAQVDASGCYTNVRGKLVCANGSQAVVANPNTGSVTTVQKNALGTTTAQSSTGAKAAYNPRTGNLTKTEQNANGTTTAKSSTGARAAYNPNTGNAVASQQNANGVTSTQTSRGGEAKTKNGKGVVQGPGGATCAKSANGSGCTR